MKEQKGALYYFKVPVVEADGRPVLSARSSGRESALSSSEKDQSRLTSAATRRGSWSQCVSKKKWRLSMNRRICRQVLECSDGVREVTALALADTAISDPKRRLRRLRRRSPRRSRADVSLSVHGPDARPNNRGRLSMNRPRHLCELLLHMQQKVVMPGSWPRCASNFGG